MIKIKHYRLSRLLGVPNYKIYKIKIENTQNLMIEHYRLSRRLGVQNYKI